MNYALKNISPKIFLLLTLLLGWSGVSWAQSSSLVKSIEATFNNPSGNTSWDRVVVTPHALDESGVTAGDVTIAVAGTAALKNPQNDLTSEFLGPNDQTNDGNAQTYTFTVNGLPVGSKFDKIALPLKGVNSGGRNQNAGIKQVNVAIVVTDGDKEIYRTDLINKSLTTQTVGEVHENISVIAPASFTTNTGRLVVKFTISRGSDNAGCFMAFHGLNLISIDKLADVNLKFVDRNGAAYSGDTKLVRYTPAGGGDAVDFGPSNTQYSFGNVVFDRANFSGVNGYVLENVVLTEVDGQQTLTFTVTTDPYVLRYSAQPTSTGWADDTHWFTMRNNRNNQTGHNRKYVTTSAEGVNADFNILPILATMPQDRGSYWCFVGDNTNGFVIQNAAYGPDFVLGIYGNAGQNNIVRMVPKDNIPTGFNTLFTAVDNAVIDDATRAYAFRIGLTGGVHVHVTTGNFFRYNNEGAMSSGDTGSAFKLTAADPDTFDNLQEYDVYKSVWSISDIADFGITYPATGNVFGRRGTLNNGDFFIVKHGSSVTLSDFQVTDASEYNVDNVTVESDDRHAYRLLMFNIVDALATEVWTAYVTEGYTMSYNGQRLSDAQTFKLRPGVIPTFRDLNVLGAENKFAWGPVIDPEAKAVTYQVRDLATDLATGWYQMQVVGNEAQITGLRDQIVNDNGNINTSANTLYLAPAVYEPGNNRIFKVTGIPQYADQPSTFVYIRNNGNGNLTLQNPSTGLSLTGPQFSFNNGLLTKPANWSIENPAHPLEGPYLLPQGNQSLSFHVTPAPMSEYNVFQVNIEGLADVSGVRLNINNSDVLGNTIVANGGYIFMKKDVSVPTRANFAVKNGNVSVEKVVVGDKENDITPITITVSTRNTVWHVYLTGEAVSTEDRVTYRGINYVNGAAVEVPFGTTPSALDFSTTVTDRFVWGPVINAKQQTVTFEVRTPATELVAGNWYQMVLRDKAGQVYNGGVKTVDSMVDAVNGMAHLRQKSNYIYPITASATDWPFELTGLTGDDMTANTYIYVKRVSNNNITLMMQNNMHLNQNGQGYSSDANSVPLVYQPESKAFRWEAKAIPWENLRSNVGVGNTNNANSGNMEYFMTQAPIKAYKVAISNGIGTLVYNGEAELIGSNRATNGGFIFVKEGQSLETDATKYELKGVDATITGITTNITDGITTLNVQIQTPTYDHEIIHRQAKYYDMLETDANKPGHGYIREGEGWIVRQGTNGETIREQNTAVFEIPIYLKQGDNDAFTSYLPTDQLGSYQRWYNWDTDGLVDGNVLITPAKPAGDYSTTNYRNGHLTSNQGIKPTFKLPADMENYNVGLDISRLTDGETYTSGVNAGSRLEPTLGMRIIYQVRDAKQMAKALKDSTSKERFLEVHNIAYPNVKHGMYEDKTSSNLLPLDLDLNNYWIFDGNGETNADLLQLTQNGSLQMIVELAPGSAPLQNVMKIPAGQTRESGNIQYSEFNTGHFILFQYPEGGVVEPGSTATINVYLQKNGSNQKYNLAQFNLTFIGNAEPVPVTELVGSHRHPDALAEAFGAPVSELTFDNKANEEHTGHYRYPLNYKGVSYAFGTMQGRTWFASRGEYALRREAGTSGGISNTYYPVNNYLRNMGDADASLGGKENDSYFLYIDAADQPGKVASIELEDALCAGSRLYCYGYIGCTSGGTQYYGNTDQNPTSILINVMGIDKDTNKEVLIYSYCPGIISSRGYDKDGRQVWSAALGRSTVYENHSGDANYWSLWQQVGFSFAIDAKTAAQMRAYSVQIVNNAYNSNGADTVLDDFEIYVKKPGAEVQNTTPLCSDQIRHIKVITEYQTLLEATGDDDNHDGLMNVGFCFLDKEIYDQVLKDNADKDAEHGYERDDPENKYNKAFGEALMGKRTLDKSNKDHAFHNFDIIRDGQVSTIDGVTKKRFYTDIPQYSFKESGDDVVYRDSIRGERYIVFKESVAHGEPSGLTQHKWTAGKSYYLLFSTATISEEHVDNHDLGCTVFNLDDNRCAVLHEFTVAPPVTIKGDVEKITSGDEVQACAGQTATLMVNLNGRTETKDVIIKNLNYDWWMSAPTHEVYQMEFGVPVRDAQGNRIPVLDGDGNVQIKEYNTVPATLQNYMNVWHGYYQQDNQHLNKKAGDKIYLSDALLELRRAYPNVTDLIGVVPAHKTGDTVEYELTQDMIDCVAHFLEPDENGYPPLLLMKKEMNLTLGVDYADEDKVVHFVVIPIAPSIYSVDEDAIYCPDPQELKVTLLDSAPSLANGFNNMEYPEVLNNIPMRVGLQQINAVRHRTQGTQRTLTVPLRKAAFAYPEVGKRLIKTFESDLFIVGSDDPEYKRTTSTSTDIGQSGEDEDIEELFVNAGRVEVLSVEKNDPNPTMQIVFNSNVIFREGYTYTMKVKYYEVMEDNERDKACEGSFVFDMKVVPEYQVWTGVAGNTDWTNDRNWARADRDVLKAGNQATGNKMAGATALDDATSYVSNADNTTAASFVPMYFTNVLFCQTDSDAVQLYKGSDFQSPVSGTRFLEGLKETATPFITYDLSVTPVRAADRESMTYDCDYECELFDTYIANGVTFTPATQMENAHFLNYRKAWVEYELDANRWYTIGSPLKNSYAGDWYSPTNGGKQNTPHFYEINFRTGINDRFRPAYYQRSWDHEGSNKVYQKSGGNYDSYVRADWSNVYNDARVNYTAGGFSVKAELDYMKESDRPADSKVLVRQPKADQSYTYYDIAGQTGQAADAQIGNRAGSYRLHTDDLLQDGSGTINLTVTNVTQDNNFLLLSNPFMAAMDMDEFFDQNTDLEEKYWIVDADHQVVSVKTAGQWLTTGAGGKYVAPMQGFFVKKKADAIVQNSVNAKYTAQMQRANVQNGDKPVILRSRRRAPAATEANIIRLTAERNGATSTALVAINDNATDDYRTGEDCEAFVDGNLYALPTVYTSAGAMAQSINVRKTLDMVPVGIISSDDSPVTLSLDLSQCSYDTLYLYDRELDTYTDMSDGASLSMSGNNSGRYFLTTSIQENVTESEEIRQGVWNLNGVYCGDSVQGLTPGLYIVNGVKMMIR